MAKRHSAEERLPPCYAHVLPGLEEVAGQEIVEELGGKIKRTASGVVVFRLPEIDPSLLRLRTTEDVFLLAWGTDKLSYRAEALDSIQRWTAREANWDLLLRIHHSIRPKPKGRPTYHLVTQLTGEHGFRRTDAREAMARGLAAKLPASWRLVNEDAAIEIWLTIHDTTATCGLRLSDRTMRHRTYKMEHLPASLRPTLAAAMVRLADLRPGLVVLDPMCGAGTILAEASAKVGRGKRAEQTPHGVSPLLWGGDCEANAVRAAGINLRRVGSILLARWDAQRLPLPDAGVDRIISNPPFGKQLSSPVEIGPLYHGMLSEYDRVLRPKGRAVLLVSEARALQDAAVAFGWKRDQQIKVRVLGQPAWITVWRKPG